MKNLIIIFAKYPEPGKVKTRLAKALGEKRSVELYKNFIRLAVSSAKKTKQDVRIYFLPANKLRAFKKLLGEKLVFRGQSGNGLGERMYNALSDSFADGYSKAALIGTDIPEIDSCLLNRGFKELGKHDAVIGPANDGGYYLIGFNKVSLIKEIFKNIPWSTAEVFRKTLEIFKKNKISSGILPAKTDIDTIKDLRTLFPKKLFRP